MSDARRVAEHEPYARVLPMLTPPHLDRDFDYLVSAEQSDAARPGVRVKVRFHGRLTDGMLLSRGSTTEHTGTLGWLERVVSAEPVLTPGVAGLVDAVAARYAGTRADVLRLAVPPRHAAAEKRATPEPGDPLRADRPVADPGGWPAYTGGHGFLDALGEHRAARAVWQALAGEQWPERLAEAAAVVVGAGRGALIVLPDQRDVDAVQAAALRHLDGAAVAALSAGLGPSQRYQRWLSVLRGRARLVIGTRSAVFAPVADLGLLVVWDDGDDTLAEPRAPYPHAREVAMLRAHQERCAALIGGFARTAEAQALVASRWAHDLVAPRATVRARAPRVLALEDDGYAQERDPAAKTARLPSMALRAARGALSAGAPVLIQVPRRGYVPALACRRCRTAARCRQCTGPLSLPERVATGAVCRWCGRVDPRVRCAQCGSDELRAVVVGARRTAEELGRAFPGTAVFTSSGEGLLGEVPDGPALVVATPGAEPAAPGGYGAALLLDGWSLLGREDLRAAEDALRRWLGAAALVRSRGEGGVVAVIAESVLPTVQALVRWDPVGHAEAELAARTEVGLPPATRMAAVDGSAAAALLDAAHLPESAQVLGPVDLPPFARRPAGSGPGDPIGRMLVRVPRADGLAMSTALRRAAAVRSARHDQSPMRVQVDPLHIG